MNDHRSYMHNLSSCAINKNMNKYMIINKVYFRLSHDVVTLDVDRDVSTAYC